MSEKTGNTRVLISTLIVVILVIIFFLPRLLMANFSSSNPWACYIYQYSFGFITFAIGILLILKTKACQFGRGQDSYWFKWLIGGFIFYAGAHALWIYLA